MKVSALLLCAWLLGIAGGSAFDMDMTPPEARSKLGLLAVEDLLVGDSGRLRALTFCTQSGKLFIPADVLLTDYKSSYSFVVTREPGNTLALETVIEQTTASSDQDAIAANETIARSLLYSSSVACPEGTRLMSVSTVNGKASFQALLSR